MKVYVTRKFKFEASHRLENYDGECSKLHGHSYKLEVTVSGEPNFDSNIAVDNMVIDFKDLKNRVNSILKNLDHTYLNDTFEGNTTAEYMVVVLFGDIQFVLPKDVKLESVKLWETEDSYAEYRG